MVKFLYTFLIVSIFQIGLLYLTHYLAWNVGSNFALATALILEGIFVFGVIWFAQYALNNK